MERDLFNWTNVVMNIIEIAAIGAIVLRLTHLHREITALVRVVRRMDRKTPDTKAAAFAGQAEVVSQAEVERARMRATGSGQ